MTVRVLIADDNPIVRMGLVSLLELADVEVCGQAESGPEALAMAERTRPDVVLLDVRMPGGGGLGVLEAISRVSRVLMLTYSDEPAIVSQALRGGATGYLVHGSFDSAELVVAVRDTAAGATRLSPQAASVLLNSMSGEGEGESGSHPAQEPGSPLDLLQVQRYRLSRREIDIAEEMVLGRTNGEIAKALFIEEKTVKNHINRLFAKLAVANRSAAIATLLGVSNGSRPRSLSQRGQTTVEWLGMFIMMSALVAVGIGVFTGTFDGMLAVLHGFLAEIFDGRTT